MSSEATPSRRFAIALSFPGEHRGVVEQVANQLAASFSQERVLYDKYHDAEFARTDLDVYLPNLYRTQSELVVIFLCPEYAAKRWCQLEWRHIRQLIATADEGRIMFLSFGNPGDLTALGILGGDGYIDILQLTHRVVAEKIVKRLRLNQDITPEVKPPALALSSAGSFDISRILKYAPAQLIGRGDELKLLHDAWAGIQQPASSIQHPVPRPHVLTFVALGGEGKTSLVAKWAAELAAQDWPGCDAAFAWSFYSQGTREQQAASSDLFLKEALTFFGDDADKAFAASPAGAYEKGQRLASLIGKRHCLLILDGLEPLQYAPTAPTPGELKDQGIAALLKGLAAASHGLCIVTTRYSLPDLKAFWQTTAPEVKLLRLSREAGVHLLKTLGVRGTTREFETLVEDVKGHALTLTLLGGFLKRACHGDIRQRDRVKFEKADEKMDGGHAFRTMAAYEQWLLRDGGDEGRREVAVLRLMGLFDRPADAGCLAALRREPIPGLTEPLDGLADDDWEYCLSGLEAAKLLTVNRDASGALVSLDAHPLLREYFAAQVCSPGFSRSGPHEPPKGGTTSEAWRAAHRRLYEHLCAIAPECTKTNEEDQLLQMFGMRSGKDKREPTLEDLQPLYQAVAHGCQAGLKQEACGEVFRARINRVGEGYSGKKLGAFGSNLGATACFFEIPWNCVSPELTEFAQAWLLHDAARSLRALGRLSEAFEPLQLALRMRTKQELWDCAAGDASDLSELELTLGEVAGAVRDAEQSVTYADRSGDAFHRMAWRTTYADALHQAGRQAEAMTRFREAEQMQVERQPNYPLLYSLQGFRYCDLLLAAPERVAWQRMFWTAGGPRPQHAARSPSVDESPGQLAIEAAAAEDGRTPLLESCRVVSQRAAQTLKWAVQFTETSLLTLALDHLTLGRAALYAAILERSAAGSAGPAAATRDTGGASVPASRLVSSLAPPAAGGVSPTPALQTLESARRELDAAVAGIRHANRSDYLPRALLTRAWLRFLTGARTGTESAQEDLDEAWEIAERGPMRLFMADIHLYRARLFGRQKLGARSQELGEHEYPWESPAADLKAAEELINKCGYHRRDEELADAKRALDL